MNTPPSTKTATPILTVYRAELYAVCDCATADAATVDAAVHRASEIEMEAGRIAAARSVHFESLNTQALWHCAFRLESTGHEQLAAALAEIEALIAATDGVTLAA